MEQGQTTMAVILGCMIFVVVIWSVTKLIHSFNDVDQIMERRNRWRDPDADKPRFEYRKTGNATYDMYRDITANAGFHPDSPEGQSFMDEELMPDRKGSPYGNPYKH